MRSGITQTVAGLPCGMLRILNILVSHDQIAENIALPNLVKDRDAYTLMMGHLASFTALKRLHITGPIVITPNFFEPLLDSNDVRLNQLEDFLLEFAPEIADGRWFFDCDHAAFNRARTTPPRKVRQNIYWNEDKRFRSAPNLETYDQLLLSAAEACQRMPKIRRFTLKLNNNHNDRFNRMTYSCVDRIFALWLVKAGTSIKNKSIGENAPAIPDDRRLIDRDRIYWRVGDYMPSESILNRWRNLLQVSGSHFFLEEAKCTYPYVYTMEYIGSLLGKER
jgi:hypothetical protein